MEELFVMLEQLAVKLNIGSETIFKAYHKQALIYSLSETFICIMLVVIAILTIKFAQYKTSFINEPDWIDKKAFSSWVLAWVVCIYEISYCVIVTLCVLIYIVSTFTSIISGFFNPEYWMIKEVAKLL